MIQIKLQNAGYSENDEILRDIDISIETGKKLVILGESGCGKSTLIKIVAGLNKNYNGSVEYNKKKISANTVRMSYMPQKNSLLPWYTLYENVILLKSSKDKNIDKTKVHQLLQSINIFELKDKYPHQLSGGEQQRASLASAILFEPEIVLMDEPFSALDEVTRQNVQLLFCSLQKKYGFSVLFVTHSIEEALLVADKIIVLSKKTNSVCHALELDALTPWSTKFYQHANNLREVIKYAKI